MNAERAGSLRTPSASQSKAQQSVGDEMKRLHSGELEPRRRGTQTAATRCLQTVWEPRKNKLADEKKPNTACLEFKTRAETHNRKNWIPG